MFHPRLDTTLRRVSVVFTNVPLGRTTMSSAFAQDDSGIEFASPTLSQNRRKDGHPRLPRLASNGRTRRWSTRPRAAGPTRTLSVTRSFRRLGSCRLRPKLFRPGGKCRQRRFPQGEALACSHHLDVALLVFGKADLKQIGCGFGSFVFHFCFLTCLESVC